MPRFVTRRHFLTASAASSAAVVASPVKSQPAAARGTDSDFPRTSAERTQAVVRFCHFDLDQVRNLIMNDKSLALASWDWGFGDWETALGAASHVGRRDIIDYLLANGARPDHFTFAAMDDVDSLRAVCTALPGIQRHGGPHGITLLDHARHGKAQRTTEYLLDLGAADIGPGRLAMSDDEIDACLGRYRFEHDGGVALLVQRARRPGGFGILREGGTYRELHRAEEHAFTPAGAPHVIVRFGFENGRATGLTVHRNRPVLTATRIPE